MATREDLGGRFVFGEGSIKTDKRKVQAIWNLVSYC